MSSQEDLLLKTPLLLAAAAAAEDTHPLHIHEQALLGQMYEEGYGCKRNPKAAREWKERAELRGYRMKGELNEVE